MMSFTPIRALLLCLLFFFAAGLFAQQSTVISIQGTLKDGNGLSVPDGNRAVTFRLYEQAVGGTALWEEEATIEVIGGVYSHNLGSVEELVEGDFDKTVYLGITFGGSELTPRTQMTYAPYALSVFAAQRIARQGCSGQVGDVKYSILNPTQFAAENGECWVPMDGRAIAATTRLAQVTGMGTVPDMSGLFIRATEYNDGTDPDRAAMAASSVQGSANLSHGHSMSSAGQHNHRVDGGGHTHFWKGYNNVGGGDHAQVKSRNGNGNNPNDRVTNHDDGAHSHNVSQSGNHTHNINSSGGAESRPVNRNFFIYIRVD